MSLYAVGDLHGCLEPLQRLLDYVHFDPTKDCLWLTGDLINRGPNSMGCLQFVSQLGTQAQAVLGNHDLYILALYFTQQTSSKNEINRLLNHPDADSLFQWLSTQPLLRQDTARQLIMTHAGIPPVFSDTDAINKALEITPFLTNSTLKAQFFSSLLGNSPSSWHSDLTGMDRIRYLVNAFTRMRFCDINGTLEFTLKEQATHPPMGYLPWFQWPKQRHHTLIFGHWAALMGKTQSSKHIGLDTGFVWGNYLTLINLDTLKRFHCDTEHRIWESREPQ